MLRRNTEAILLSRAESTELRNLDRSLVTLLFTQKWVAYSESMLKTCQDFFSYAATAVVYGLIGFTVLSEPTYSEMPPGKLAQFIADYVFIALYLMNCLTRLVDLATSISDMGGYVARVGQLHESLKIEKEISNNSSIVTNNEVDEISYRDVTICSPDERKVLIKELTMNIKRQRNVIIMGPNGSGKTALVRALYGLWPIVHGEITTPSFESLIGRKRIMVVPQTTLMTRGSLKAQIIYPEDVEDLSEDEQIFSNPKVEDILGILGLTELIHRFEGLDKQYSLNHWLTALSPGEMQRLAFGRILYWKPDFAVLDEATSFMDNETEKRLYTLCKEMGITLVTITHHERLIYFHEILLRFTGQGSYVISSLRFE